MTKFTKPMLADDANLDNLRFPLLASAKLDGIRAIVVNGVVMSRSLKPIPNKFVQALFGGLEYSDGELIVGDPTSKTVYRDTVSHVMSHDKSYFPVSFYMFDHIEDTADAYYTRASRLEAMYRRQCEFIGPMKLHKQYEVGNLDDLLTIEAEQLELGYEGLILRCPHAPYKAGRSTAKQGWLLKLKRFSDAEAVVTGFQERMHNANEATTDALGHTARSSHQANKHGRGDLGALLCDFGGQPVSIGTGFTDAERKEIWDNQTHHVGKTVKFKFFAYGVKDAPRHPVFLGWRSKLDM